MRINLLFLFAITLGAGSFTFVHAQTSTYEGPLRGEMTAPPTNHLELEAALETVKMDIMISEIEDAGFSMDVNEGFDEEWEEEIGVDADADEMETLVLVSDESDLMEADELVSQDELLEEWEDPTRVDPEMALEEDEEDGFELIEDDLWEGEISSEESEFALLEDDTEDEYLEETEWWIAEDGYDESWEDIQEEWEMEELDSAYESEDMEYMEMMYGMD